MSLYSFRPCEQAPVAPNWNERTRRRKGDRGFLNALNVDPEHVVSYRHF